VQSALKYLKSLSDQDTSSLSLAVSALALIAYQQPAHEEIKYLINRQKPDGSFATSIVATALAALALQADKDSSMHVLNQTKIK
jgi:squalene cyclase